MIVMTEEEFIERVIMIVLITDDIHNTNNHFVVRECTWQDKIDDNQIHALVYKPLKGPASTRCICLFVKVDGLFYGCEHLFHTVDQRDLNILRDLLDKDMNPLEALRFLEV